ncbi:MAG: phosphohydrolase [Candidatus Eremiobacteraeota bacterium]|nr:phosphohydrolase [Candidatus Eremiobacteraeota bacterium]MBV8333083.1 phosphohydrolase [Candidatus Eremiobacteraeota bacterium]MBV8433799.1 phosphohydrolase [Candidatus Eremiobacteraeota bacterium]MBV8720749.1 phosphohydrolase [Candidatus Eremiobacteraeota bacterium]
MLLAVVLALATAAPTQTVSGIPLDAPWKVTIYDLAREKYHHPAWGWQHSERNYLLAMQIARADGITVDTDVLFAAAFLHDMAAFQPCADEKMEHGECAARESGAILRSAGFPMQKFPAVQAAERGHMYYSDPGSQPEAILLHDADSLDFLGDIGAARMLSLVGEKAETFQHAVDTLREFVRDIPPKLITKRGRRIGAERAEELTLFLDRLDTERLGVKP